jgi:predicted Zn-dependent protease
VSRTRVIFLSVLLAAGALLCALLLASEANTPLGRTLAPLLTLLGQTTKTADRALSKVLPIDDLDEATLGQALASEMSARYGEGSADQVYVQTLVRELAAGARKPFAYRAFIADGEPNAFALPGGVVLVTRGLLAILTSEAQLASVVGHEIGHVELGHCYDAARFQLLASKIHGQTLGELADAVYGFLAHASFSKTQEDEADGYGFETLIAKGYDPMAMSEAFALMQKSLGERTARGIDPFRDYFRSHPPIELRIDKFRERARRWRERHPDAPIYAGQHEFARRVTRATAAER